MKQKDRFCTAVLIKFGCKVTAISGGGEIFWVFSSRYSGILDCFFHDTGGSQLDRLAKKGCLFF